MKTSRNVISALIILAALGACAPANRAEKAMTAQTTMIGMNKEDVLACMGPPANKAAEGATEVWSYPSGNGATSSFATNSAFGQATAYGSPHFASSTGSAFGFGSSYTQRRFCMVNIVMRAGSVAAVNYNGPTGGWATKGEQCAYAVDNCVR